MSLLARAFTETSLMRHQLEVFTRTRTTETGRNPTTGAPVTSTATLSISGYFQWASSVEAQDFKGDTAAILFTTPTLLRAGDTLISATLGRFLVLEEGPQQNGAFDRVPLRRA